MHDIYREGKGLAVYAPMLEWAARSFLEKSTLVRRIEGAKIITALLEAAVQKLSDDPARPEVMGLMKLSREFFEPLVDDVLLLSAFENMAKASLLRRRYVVHEITRPRLLVEKQKTKPVHVRTVQSQIANGVSVEFKVTTIGIGLLLKEEYLRVFPLPINALNALEDVRSRRNLVHFNFGLMWRISPDLLSLVDHLNAKIPKHRVGRSLAAA